MEQKWTTIIKPKTGWFDVNLKEVVQYRDLIFLFVKRNFAVEYKQTILGPLWFIINPLLTTIISTLVFGGIAGIETDGVPYFLFYLTGYTIWNYFSICISQTSNTFSTNAAIFGKVYFPRLTMPIATVIYSLVKMGIIFVMALIGMLIYWVRGTVIHPNLYMLLIPVFIVQTAILGLGFGIIISSLTTKYRDLTIVVGFGVQLWMYITPIVYPASRMSGLLGTLIWLNPVTPLVNNFRYALLGSGWFEWGYWGISILTSFVVLCIGVMIFSRVEKTFMDTI